MKRLLFLASVLILAGCASENARLTDQPQLNPDGSRSYSQENLQKTGRQTPGDALSQADPAISVSHH